MYADRTEHVQLSLPMASKLKFRDFDFGSVYLPSHVNSGCISLSFVLIYCTRDSVEP